MSEVVAVGRVSGVSREIGNDSNKVSDGAMALCVAFRVWVWLEFGAAATSSAGSQVRSRERLIGMEE